MCGIIGYIGYRQAQPVLFECLAKLEYRGYDSCGLAVCGNSLSTIKEAVRVKELHRQSAELAGHVGIGHTRWATHGQPSRVNAHPHLDCSGKIAVVHNGIITNYQKLKNQLRAEGHHFVSETDTEVISHLVEKHFEGNLLKAVQTALREVQGSYAVAVVMEGIDEVVVSRNESPLVIGLGKGENLIASDFAAILGYSNQIIYLEDGDTARIREDSLEIWEKSRQVTRQVHEISWDRNDISKSGFDYFMYKEIREQPNVICQITRANCASGEWSNPLKAGANIRDILFLACGTSHYASLIGKYLIEELLGIPVRVELASEFNHRNRLIIPSLAIALTQSGETADVLTPLKKLKETSAKKLVITNVPGSSASRIADYTIYTPAGPEVSVAATKSFIAQIVELYQLVICSDLIDPKTAERIRSGLADLPAKVQLLLDQDDQIVECSDYLAKHSNVFFLGRGVNFPIALEGALKLKEISYIHAEGYAAGELKHGPFALLDENTPVVALVVKDGTYESIMSNLVEVNARKAPVIAITNVEDEEIRQVAKLVVRVPHCDPILSPIVNAVAVQLIAFFTAKALDRPIDFPRNLAKSVTVE